MITIEKISFKSEVDTYPDLSWLGEYGKQPRKWAVDRKYHGGYNPNREYRYFYPAWPPTDDMAREKKVQQWKDCMRNFDRVEAYNQGQWCMLTVNAVAEIVVNGTIQNIHSGYLGGIESDSDQDYMETIAAEQLDELRVQLKELGFTDEQIQKAEEEIDA